MQLESQVVSLELAKRLKELGVKQESVFAWTAASVYPETNWELWSTGRSVEEWVSDGRIAAFTVAELGEMLYGRELPHSMAGSGYWETNEYFDFSDGRQRIDADTEADARARMLVYLIENKLITL